MPQAHKKIPRGLYMRGKTWWLRYAGIDGKIIYESSETNKRRDAEARLHKRKADIKEGKQPVFKTIGHYTFKDLSDEYLKFTRLQSSFKSKSSYLDQLNPYFGCLPLRKFNTLILEQYQTKRKTEMGNKPATINRHIATIKHMFTKAVDWDMVEEETLKRVRKVKMLKEDNQRLRYLSPEECEKLINECRDYVKDIVIMALNTGMRINEILPLKWDSTDLQHGFIHLDKTKNGERRDIPINDTLRQTLNNIIRRLDVPYVFYNKRTGRRYKDIKTGFNAACRRADIKDFHFHDLRHTFASYAVMGGVDLTTLKEILGHKTLTMTLRYAHLTPYHKVKAVGIVDDMLNKNSTIQKLYKTKEVAN